VEGEPSDKAKLICDLDLTHLAVLAHIFNVTLPPRIKKPGVINLIVEVIKAL